jgi:N-acetyl-anhydromuramyl-L-alanine amidase AmpD
MTTEEYDLKKRELELKILENNLKMKEMELKGSEETFANKIKSINPVTTTILVSVLGILGTLIASYYQKNVSLEIEKWRFQYQIYSKAQESSDSKKAAEILDFYVAANLIPGEKGQFSKLVEKGGDVQVPIFDQNSPSIEKKYPGIIIPKPQEGEWNIKNSFLVGNKVNYIISTNSGEVFNPSSPDAIIIGYTATSSLDNISKYLQAKDVKASVHFLIGKNGEVIQMLPLNYVGWGAGISEYDGRTGWNKYSIFIELVNEGSLKKENDKYYTMFGTECHRDSVVFAKHKFESSLVYWAKYTPQQIEATKKLCKVLAEKYNIKYILGKDDISRKRKFSPGPAFPLEEIRLGIIKN